MKKINKLILRWISFVCAVFIMALIFYMSSKNSAESSEISGGVIRQFAEWFNRNFDKMTLSQQNEYISSFQFFVRKSAHFSIYTLLGVFLTVGMLTFRRFKWPVYDAFSVLVGVCYAITDEVHQLFVDGRSGEVRDVLIDSGGIVLGCFVITVFYLVLKNRKKEG